MELTESKIPDYSVAAKKVLPLMQKDKILVYVEGPKDDIDFWRSILSEFCGEEILEFVPKPGDKGLRDFEEILESGASDFLVARDADYEILAGKARASVCILHTYSHSIENVILCRCKYQNLLKKYSRIQKLEDSTSRQIFLEFNSSALELFIYDAALRILGRSERIFEGAFDQYADKTRKIWTFDMKKVDEKIKSIAADEPLSSKVEEIKKLGIEPCDGAKGHFVFSFFRRRLEHIASSKRGESVRIKNDHFFSDLLEPCDACPGGNGCRSNIKAHASQAIKMILSSKAMALG